MTGFKHVIIILFLKAIGILSLLLEDFLKLAFVRILQLCIGLKNKEDFEMHVSD